MKIAVVGATGDVGRRVVAKLCDKGHKVVATSRSADRLIAFDPRAETAVASVHDASTLAAVLRDADRIVNISHPSTIEKLLPLVPSTCERLIVVGSTRRYSAIPDKASETTRAGEQAFLSCGLPGSILHPTMIYGGTSEQNVTRILALVSNWPRWLPVLWPIPNGGKALVQPVHVDDVAAAIVSAATTDSRLSPVIVVAGPEPIRLAEMLREIVATRGRRLRIMPVPTPILIIMSRLLTRFFGATPFSIEEIQRSREDKEYDIESLKTQLGIEPRSFAEGLNQYKVRQLDQAKLACGEQSVER